MLMKLLLLGNVTSVPSTTSSWMFLCLSIGKKITSKSVTTSAFPAIQLSSSLLDLLLLNIARCWWRCITLSRSPIVKKGYQHQLKLMKDSSFIEAFIFSLNTIAAANTQARKRDHHDVSVAFKSYSTLFLLHLSFSDVLQQTNMSFQKTLNMI